MTPCGKKHSSPSETIHVRPCIVQEKRPESGMISVHSSCAACFHKKSSRCIILCFAAVGIGISFILHLPFPKYKYRKKVYIPQKSIYKSINYSMSFVNKL